LRYTYRILCLFAYVKLYKYCRVGKKGDKYYSNGKKGAKSLKYTNKCAKIAKMVRKGPFGKKGGAEKAKLE